MIHQYIERQSAQIRTETLYNDAIVNAIYSDNNENGSLLFRALTSARFSKLLGFLTYDLPLGAKLTGAGRFADKLGIDFSECLDDPASLDSARKIFERKIRYWETRPMIPGKNAVVSPADAKVLVGSFSNSSEIFIKEKFFNYTELIGQDRWLSEFENGDFAIFRLTPEKYHYNHTPVAGKVVDIYEIPGCYYPCNPGAVMALASPYSKNKRIVTIIDTDVEHGTGVGLVAMIEIVALMIGEIVQSYSEDRYDTPQEVLPGMFLKKGQPKSLYRPGSSTDVLIFQKGRITFCFDLVMNMYRHGVKSRFSHGLGRSLAETEVMVRSKIGVGK